MKIKTYGSFPVKVITKIKARFAQVQKRAQIIRLFGRVFMLTDALVIIDPQNDFCDPKGSLYVDGAAEDIARLAGYIRREGKNIAGIFISLDSHDASAIFHPAFWVDASGNPPAPFTPITAEDFRSSVWKTASNANKPFAARAFAALEAHGGIPLMVWPEHCVVSTWGYEIAAPLKEALEDWRGKTGLAVRYVFKGENPYTDQFSVFEGVDASYPETAFNENLLARLAAFGQVTFAGEALSHCVQESILSYARRRDGGQRVRLLTDCTSPVRGFDGKASLEILRDAGTAFITAGGS
jgi:nicotinamidase-related amidase